MTSNISSTSALNDLGAKQAGWHLPAHLLAAVQAQATLEGVTTDAIAARVVEIGLRELGLMPNGRCSVRTGLCGSGPTPLPMQQSS